MFCIASVCTCRGLIQFMVMPCLHHSKVKLCKMFPYDANFHLPAWYAHSGGVLIRRLFCTQFSNSPRAIDSYFWHSREGKCISMYIYVLWTKLKITKCVTVSVAIDLSPLEEPSATESGSAMEYVKLQKLRFTKTGSSDNFYENVESLHRIYFSWSITFYIIEYNPKWIKLHLFFKL